MSKRRIGTTDRKRRPDSWEIKAGLNDADLRRVFEWARSLGYGKAIELIRKELNVAAPEKTAFGDWYAYYAKLDSEERVHRAIVNGTAIRDLAKDCGDVSDAMTAALESEASAAILSGDPDRIRLLVNLALKARGGRRSDEALQLEVTKYQTAMQSSIEKGLAALAAKAKGNAVALKHYQAFRQAILQSIQEVAA